MRIKIPELLSKTWGDDFAFTKRAKNWVWMDIPVFFAFLGLFYIVFHFAKEWAAPLRPSIEIDLSLGALPKYTFFSLARGMIAYVLSLLFTIVYGYCAAKNKHARRVLVPLLDILQSIPVLGFMPGLVLGLVTLFPHNNVGLELAAVMMIFTSQVWNMTFSFYSSIRSVPNDLLHVAKVFRFSTWRIFKWIELPYATTGLIWNSMMSMAGGWFFLMVSEAFVLGNKDFRLPGIGAYMSVAVVEGNKRAMACAVVAMVIMIVCLDQFFWSPIVVWAQKFRMEEGSGSPRTNSFFLELLKSSNFIYCVKKLFNKVTEKLFTNRIMAYSKEERPKRAWLSRSIFGVYVVLVVSLLLCGVKLVSFMRALGLSDWILLGKSGFLTLLRVLATLILGTVWTVPVGIVIGLSPRLSRIFQPLVQIVASFPAPMLFPVIILLLHRVGVELGWGSILLMLLGTQWYILFNVIAGASSIPSDLKEAACVYKFSRWECLLHLYLPAIFPYLVTGWVTAAGGAWNASIVAEYVIFNGKTLTASGLGSIVSLAADRGNFPLLAGAVFTMSAIVVIFNRTVWKKLYKVAREKYSLV